MVNGIEQSQFLDENSYGETRKSGLAVLSILLGFAGIITSSAGIENSVGIGIVGILLAISGVACGAYARYHIYQHPYLYVNTHLNYRNISGFGIIIGVFSTAMGIMFIAI